MYSNNVSDALNEYFTTIIKPRVKQNEIEDIDIKPDVKEDQIMTDDNLTPVLNLDEIESKFDDIMTKIFQ